MTPKSPRDATKSSTERVRKLRARLRQQGVSTSNVALTLRGSTALEVIQLAMPRVTKLGAVEAALFREAKRICPNAETADRMAAEQRLSRTAAEAWKLELSVDAQAIDQVTIAKPTPQA